MNLKYMSTFIDLVKLGSYSKAAQKLSISQPAVSFQIRKLEEELNIPLVDHTKKKLVTTEAGKRLFRFAEHIEQEKSDLLNEFDNLRQEIIGELTIAASPIPGEYILPAILGEFKEHYPAVGISVQILESSNVLAETKNGSFDFGFCTKQPNNQDMEYFKMDEHEAVLIVYPGHPFSFRKEVELSELTEEPLILRTEVSNTQESPQALLFKAGLDLGQCQTKLVLGSYMGVITAVEARTGIGIVSNKAIARSVALGLVKVVRIKGLILKRDIFCIFDKDKLSSKLHSEFINFIKSKRNGH
jgi:DNA-binding transcriptional LysR family regulator